MKLYQITKRVIDIVLSILLLVVLSPVLLAGALALLFVEKWPVFYNSKRFISRDKSITVYKFRTMVKDAKSEKYQLHQRFMRDGYLDIPITCEVFTPLGRLMERTQLVEVPQLWNVLTGEMSLIGNRPLPYENLQLLKAHPNWAKRFDSPAGISGIAQIVGKLTLEPYQRLALESAYSDVYQHGNVLKCDLKILAHTLRVILFTEAMSLERAYEILRSSMPARDAFGDITAGIVNKARHKEAAAD